MRPIPVNLPKGAVSIGEILDRYDRPADLCQDLYQATLANGIVIDVGWRPECDPNGEFHIVVIEDEKWDHPIQTVTAKNPDDVVEIVEQLAQDYDDPVTLRISSMASGSDNEYAPGRALLAYG